MAGRRRHGLGWALGLALFALALDVQSQSPRDQPATAQVAFRIIVVSSAEKAEELAGRVTKGEDFAALARAESVDPSAPQGGLVGPIPLSDLREELRDALLSLRPGSIRGVLYCRPDSRSFSAWR
jgi:parvulin-like peptidyl-prolyl isomerase